MPIPSNTTPTTAIAIPTLPYSNTQVADNAGTTYDLWYAYTAVTGDIELSIFGYGDAAVYLPSVSAFVGPDTAPVAYRVAGAPGNRPIQIPVNVGTLYLFKFEPDGGGNPSPANFAISVESFAQQTAPIGSIAVNDDTADFPLVLMSSTTGDPIRFVSPFASGEAADTFENGRTLAADWDTNDIVLYDTDYSEITRISVSNSCFLRINRSTNTGWVGQQGGAARVAFPVTQEGGEGAHETMTGITNVEAFCASPDDTILYCAADVANAPVQRWNVTSHSIMSDLVAGIANYIPQDALGLPDGDILVGYSRESNGDFFVKRYDNAGATVQTYNVGTTKFPLNTHPRLAYATDHPTSFWTWHHEGPGGFGGISVFTHISTDSGTVINTIESTEYEGGIYVQDDTPTPTDLYGNSFSCPFWITRSGTEPPVPPPPDGDLNGPDGLAFLRGAGVLRNIPIVRLRRFPHLSDEQQRIFHQKLQIDIEAGVGTISGQGVLPDLRVRWSDDGGFTWSNGRSLGVGPQGQYRFRCITHQLGESRDRVYEITQSDPVKTVWLAAYLQIKEGM